MPWLLSRDSYPLIIMTRSINNYYISQKLSNKPTQLPDIK